MNVSRERNEPVALDVFSSEAAAQLSAQAGALRSAMGFFRVGGGPETPASLVTPHAPAPARTASPLRSAPQPRPAPRGAKAKGGFDLDLSAAEDELDAQFTRPKMRA